MPDRRIGDPARVDRCGFSAGRLSGSTDAGGASMTDASAMHTTYGVVWKEGAKPLARGRLELLPRFVRLDGIAGSEPASREIAYENLSEIRIGRSAEDRIDGHPTLVLAPRVGDTLSIASIAQAGVIAEIAERLAALQLGNEGRRRLMIVLPLAEGARDSVRALLADGPPFDPDALGLDRHEVFLTATEAVFIFESELGANALEPLLQEPDLWKSAAAWHEYLTGPPHIAEEAFSWTRPCVRVDDSLFPPSSRNGDNVRV
jgi:hypothetical protein